MTVLRIGNLKQTKVSEKTVIRQLQFALHDERIDELYFWKIDFTERLVDEVWKLFASDYRIWNNIKMLSCTGNVDSLIDVVFHYECVRSLVLSGAETSQAALQAVDRGLTQNDSIKTVRLLGIHLAERNGGITFEGLTQNNSLLELDLTRSHLQHEAVAHLSSALGENVGLETVKFEQCFLTDDEMTEIIDSVYDHPTIRHLDFSQNSGHTRSLEAIADLLASDECCLVTLNLSSQQVLVAGEKEELDITALAKAVDALRDNTSLKKLDISGNQFCNSAVEALSDCLTVNSTLRTLLANNSQISEEGIRIFARNISSFKGLKVLNIAGNEFCEAAAECLIQGLAYNRVLQSLGPIEQCSQHSHSIIEHFLDLNMGGRRALQNDIPLSVWPNLLARASHMNMPAVDDEDEATRSGRNENVLYALLRGPALFER